MYETDRRDFSAPVYSGNDNIFGFPVVDFFENNICFKLIWDFLRLFEVSWGLQRQIILVLGLGDTFKSPEII